jgi:predicted  nucleic acid-binding Zn-ribbon protein
MRAIAIVLFGSMLPALTGPVSAQDVPGIENCMAEKQIERRTGCLQSNINFLKTTMASELAKARAEARSKIDDAEKKIDALKLQVTGLEQQIRKLQAQADETKQNAPAAKPGDRSDKTNVR